MAVSRNDSIGQSVGYVTEPISKIWHAQAMKLSKRQLRRGAIAMGTGVAIATGLVAFHAMQTQNGCVKTILTSGKATTGQEIIYSWGCLAPQRFRQWSITASAPTEPQEQISHRIDPRLL